MNEAPDYPGIPYQPLSTVSFQFGPGHGLVYSAQTGPVPLDINVLRVFTACQGVQRLEEHVRSVVAADRSLEEAMVRRAINRLVAAGLLQPTDRPRQAATGPGQSPSTIDTVAIITADRAGALAMCLASLVRQLQVYGHRPQVIVVDGSQSPACRAANRRTVAAVARSWGHSIQLFGREQMIDTIAASGTLGRSLAAFALAPAAGGLRNVVLALTLDQHVLFVDDDVDCDAWVATGHADAGVRVVGHTEQRTSAFHTDRAAALFGLSDRPGDLVGAHQHLLGRTLGAVVADGEAGTDCEMACAHQTDAVATGRPMTTMMTFAGLAGDSGMAYPDRLLFATGRLRRDLSADEASYTRAMRYREGRRIADGPILTHDAGCMAYCMGLVNSRDLPPFSPVGRNQDGLFGAMVGVAMPDAICGHLPVGIRHRSDRGPEYSHRQPYPSARGTTLSGALIAMLRDTISLGWPVDAETRLKRMTQTLADLGSLTTADFREAVSRSVLNVRCRELAYIARCTSPASDLPKYWQRDLHAYQKVLLESITATGFCAAIEYAGDSADRSFAEMRGFVGRFAALLEAWPEIRRACAGLARHPVSADVSRVSLTGGASPC
jgi:hypothetical protein